MSPLGPIVLFVYLLAPFIGILALIAGLSRLFSGKSSDGLLKFALVFLLGWFAVRAYAISTSPLGEIGAAHIYGFNAGLVGGIVLFLVLSRILRRKNAEGDVHWYYGLGAGLLALICALGLFSLPGRAAFKCLFTHSLCEYIDHAPYDPAKTDTYAQFPWCVHHDRGNDDQALQMIERISKKCDECFLKFEYAKFLVLQNRMEEAASAVPQTSALSATSPRGDCGEYLFALARLMLNEGRSDLSDEIMRKVHPSSPYHQRSLERASIGSRRLEDLSNCGSPMNFGPYREDRRLNSFDEQNCTWH